MVVAACAVVGAWVAIAASHGALGAARNDDWTYIRIATHFADTGDFRLDGWVFANFIGQAVASLPVIALFGDGIAPLQLLVVAFGVLGLWAAYWLIRSWLDWRWTSLAVACLALGPVYGIVSVSFMTDVPGLALQMMTLLCGVHALRSAPLHRGWLAGALVLGFVAFSVREFGAASGAAVAICALARTWASRDRLRPVVALVGAWSVAMFAMYVWRTSLPNTWSATLDLSPRALAGAANSIWRSYLTVGLFVSPLALAVSPRRLWRRSREQLPSGALVVLVLFFASMVAVGCLRGFGFVGNHLDRFVAYWGTLPGDPVRVLPDPVWAVVVVVAFYATAVLTTLVCLRVQTAIRNRRSWRAALATSSDGGANLCALFVVLYSATLAAATILTATELFDRYWLATVPLVAALLVRAGQAEQVMQSFPGRREALSMLALAALGVVIVDASATFDGAKWQIGKAVEHRTGWEAGSIDAGYEWFGYHQSGDLELQPVLNPPNFWRKLFEPRPVCATVSFAPSGRSPVPGDDVIAVVERRSLFGIDVRLAAIAGPEDCPVPE